MRVSASKILEIETYEHKQYLYLSKILLKHLENYPSITSHVKVKALAVANDIRDGGSVTVRYKHL